MLKTLFRTNAPLTVTGVLMLPALAVAIVGILVDDTMITGAPAWLKPAKFSISIAIYAFTLAWAFRYIPEWIRTRRIVGWVSAVVLVLELFIIDIQAYRGITSHFNVSTPLDATLFAVMGSAIVAQTITSIAVAVAFWRQRFADRALGWALRLGMTITILGAFTGGLMTRPTAAQLADARAGEPMLVVGSHTVGAPDGGRGLPGTGWSVEHGDLRVPHFIGLHALQALLAVAFGLAAMKVRADARERLVVAAAISYSALYGILMLQALRGHPLIALDPGTLWLFGVWGALTASCVWLSVIHRRPLILSELI